jgi:hypothetical protein
MMTVTELLSRAKSAIESGETALHAAGVMEFVCDLKMKPSRRGVS